MKDRINPYDLQAARLNAPKRAYVGSAGLALPVSKQAKSDKARIAQLEADRDALAAALDSLKADFRLRCVEDGLWLAVEWLDDLDDHGCREILTARDARMKRAGIVELLDDFLMVNMQEPVREDEDPRDALQRLIDWETQISLDPLVSRPAKELERRGAREALRGLPGTTNSDYETDWDAGWDAYCAKVRAAIAALEQEGEGS